MFRVLLIVLVHVLLGIEVHGQCRPPTLLEITHRSKDSLSVTWSHFSVAQGWELAIYPYGENTSIMPQTGIITDKKYTFASLKAGTSYSVYLRSVCSEGVYSSWTLIQTSTVITNPSRCGLNLPITNNNCGRPKQEFLIEVDNTAGMLGKDVFVEKVEIIAEHTWPADLHISLESPSGKSTTLSAHNGVGSNDYGDKTDKSCKNTTAFSDLACMSIKKGKPPFIGTFKPEQPLRLLDDGSTPNGIWKLKMCDRSIPDIGFLRYVNITLSPLKCPLPQNFVIDDIDGTTTTIRWDYFDNCNVIELRLRPKDGNQDDEIRYSVDCKAGKFEIAKLKVDTQYDLYVLSDCFSSKSPESCPLFLTTICQQSSSTMDFDSLPICQSSCSTVCDFDGLFYNKKVQGEQYWIINNKNTPTSGTGPERDALNSGNYAYVESSPDICGSKNKATLRSKCLQVSSEKDCGLSFYYHMYGSDLGSLYVLAYQENTTTPDTIFVRSGTSKNQWKRVSIDLTPYNNKVINLEIIAVLGDGERSDIAIDEIKLLGASTIVNNYTYYQDLDLDGYGNDSLSIQICASSAPTGYSSKKGDCDDKNPNIHPNATEIPCNGIDENCNGIDDDASTTDPVRAVLSPQNESCSNTKDGSIRLSVTGGTPPYTYLWSDGSTNKDLVNISSGYYRVRVTDANGCITQSKYTQVTSKSTINIFTTSKDRPSCKGINDGKISIEATGGSPPYSYRWSTGVVGPTLSQVGGNTYTVTVTDSQNCSITSDKIVLTPKNKVKVATVDVRHPSCTGRNDGSIRVDVVSNSDSIAYRWDDGTLGKQRSQLAEGRYRVTATDSTGCFDTLSVQVTSPSQVVLKTTSIEHNDCFGDKNGTIKVSASGGTPPYTYLWSNGRTSDNIYNLPAGKYTLTVTDANVCRATSKEIRITQPKILSYNIVENSASQCLLSKDGRLIVSIQGGEPQYSYHWDGRSEKTDTLTDISSGKYTLTVIDQNQCKLKIENIEVSNTNIPLDVDIKVVDRNQCFNDSLSSIVARVSKGNFPIDYNWSNGEQHITRSLTDTITHLPPDTYTLTVTDAKGCVGKSNDIALKTFTAITTRVSTVDNTCYGEKKGAITLYPSGGTPPYKYRWQDGSSNNPNQNLAAGLYKPVIIDADMCEYTPEPILIKSPEEITATATITPSGSTNNQGSIQLNIQGGIGEYAVQWLGGVVADGNKAINLSKGYYQVQITDSNMCQIVKEYYVPQTTATSKTELYAIEVYPSPSQDVCYIRSDYRIENVKIYNMLGQRMPFQSSYIGNKMTITMLPQEVYIFVVQTSHGTSVVKHVVQ